MRKSMRSHISDCEDLYKDGAGRRPTTHHRVLYNSVHLFEKAGVKSILDVGCGCGLTTKAMLGHGFDVIGTEIVPSLLEGDLKRMDVYPWSIEDLSVVGKADYDLVLGVDLLGFLRDEEEAGLFLKEARRIGRIGVFLTVDGNHVPLVGRVFSNCGSFTHELTTFGSFVGVFCQWGSECE